MLRNGHGLLLAALGLLSVLCGVQGGLQNTNVDGAQSISDSIPRFSGNNDLNLEDIANGNTDDDDTDYAINLGILLGVCIIMGLIMLFWMCGRLCCHKCCRCWLCRCCGSPEQNQSHLVVSLVIMVLATLAFCIYGYVKNSDVHDGVSGDSGLTKEIPGTLTRVTDATDTAVTNLRFINSTLQFVVDQARTVYIPGLRDDVNNGTIKLVANSNSLGAVVGDFRFFDGVYMNYSCVACRKLQGDLASLIDEIAQQTATFIADFQSTVADVDGDLIQIASDISAEVVDLIIDVGDINADAVEQTADVVKYSKDSEEYEDERYIATICLFLTPLLGVIFIFIGTFRASRGMHSHWFSLAAYWTFVYAFFMWVVVGIHVVFTTTTSDSCVYLDFFETSPLAERAQDCIDGVRTDGACNMYKNVYACFNGSGVLAVNNVTDQLDFSRIEFPSIPNVNETFSFAELDQVTEYVSELGPQDFGLPQCYLDALINDFNGYQDSALVPPRPTTSDSVKRALWIQEHLGYPLPFPRANVLSTHNSYNRANIRTHIELNSTILNIPVEVQESPTNQRFTLTDQLTRLNIRFVEIDAHYIVPGPGSGNARHCNNTGSTPTERTRVCHAGKTIAPTIRANCASDTVGWDACEALCVCDYNNHTACGVNPPALTDVLREINTWLNNNTEEVIAIYVENLMSGEDALLNTIVGDAFGTKIYEPTGGKDYTVASNWDTRQDMVNNNTQVVLFAVTSNGDTCQTTGSASATLTHFFCQDLRNAQRVPVDSLGSATTCGDSTELFFDYVTGTVITNRVIFGSTDGSDDNTNSGANTITEAKMADIQQCGHSPDMDQVDESLVEAALWSFASGFPATTGGPSTAFFDTTLDNKWQNTATTATLRHCACRDNSTTSRLSWQLSTSAVALSGCVAACDSLGTFFVHSVPRSNKEFNNLLAAYSSQSEGVWLNLDFNAALDFNAEGAGFVAWPAIDQAQVPYGETSHPGVFDEAQINTATGPFSGSATPAYYSTIVQEAKDLIADKSDLAARQTNITTTAGSISSEAQSLLDTWVGVNDLMAQLANDTEPSVAAAERIVDILDTCASVDKSYFAIKAALCDEVVVGTGGITLAAFVIALLAIPIIIVLGLLDDGWAHKAEQRGKGDEEDSGWTAVAKNDYRKGSRGRVSPGDDDMVYGDDASEPVKVKETRT